MTLRLPQSSKMETAPSTTAQQVDSGRPEALSRRDVLRGATALLAATIAGKLLAACCCEECEEVVIIDTREPEEPAEPTEPEDDACGPEGEPGHPAYVRCLDAGIDVNDANILKVNAEITFPPQCGPMTVTANALCTFAEASGNSGWITLTPVMVSAPGAHELHFRIPARAEDGQTISGVNSVQLVSNLPDGEPEYSATVEVGVMSDRSCTPSEE